MMWIAPGKTIGILGGGQLGRMMALSAREMGYRIAVLDPGEDSPCGMVSDKQVTASYDDRSGAEILASECDVLTYEFENVTAETATFLEETMYLPQGSRLLQVSQDRLKEKEMAADFGIPVVPYKAVYTFSGLQEAVQELGLPAVLKTTRGGYDGKGQLILRDSGELYSAWEELGSKGPLVLEKMLAFDKEVSVIVTRSVHGEMTTFPTAENEHRHGILHRTIVPARISSEIEEKAQSLAERLAESLEMVGTLAVEMFVDGSDVYMNEIAPRPHNSGHFTINACDTSQFEQHIRAVCGWPLGSTKLLSPVVMVNLLGQHVEPYLRSHSMLPPAHIHLYGKKEAKHNRKMGHVTFLSEDPEALLEEIDASPVWNESVLQEDPS
ncbi:5-(carboxyamino)imidazole ribonucleotide synthase [Alkalicoccus urumqiensis]|uniref:N5-carboxyaminoimidazole ribonucleotide synthase n=1 Tax=Alkalicoccus urumqiensis TaxID=1548213 RepID=A0A2P6MIZ8_ALKUR|nr:5-(carboxyamino)imidazole ribonucleotide synthase [Alkalicoccus urumqiensis]PRO66258.1 5-(carboxyamino)imidazole ribonucleotide synthase [Alkalicoccus urumqiensis]